jgi:aminopeptidase-like protein
MIEFERILNFEFTTIVGEVVRELQTVFKELNESFEQRKSYDEYYYATNTKVTLTISKINKLNKLHYNVLIDSEYVLITY